MRRCYQILLIIIFGTIFINASLIGQSPTNQITLTNQATLSNQKSVSNESSYDDEHPHPYLTLNNYTLRMMAEFGLGNIVSCYAVIKTFMIYTGLGIGYNFINYNTDETSLHIVEPYGVFIYPVNFFLIRLRIGRSFITEKRYGFKGNTWEVSPDLLLKLKFQNIYIGTGLPIIFGSEGTGLAFTLGAGLTITF